MDSLISSLEEYVVPYAMNVVGALLLLFGAWIISGWVRKKIQRALDRAKFDNTLSKFFANMSRWLILVLALLACLSVFGIETTGFAAVVGAAGLAIGLAFQGTLSHLAAGTMLLIFRPFKVGDLVKVGGEMGRVYEIDLFMTAIDTPDNRRIIMPNSQIFGNTIENITYHDARRVDVAVGTDYGADIEETRKVLEAAAIGIEGALEDREPQILLTGLGGSSIDWEVRVWAPTTDFLQMRDRVATTVKNALEAADIGIPYPTMDINHVTSLRVEKSKDAA